MLSETQSNFIETILPVAKDEQSRSGIFPVVTITQSAHESNWGMSLLTQKANNLFGFTGDSWEREGKPVIKMPTREWIKEDPFEMGHWVTITRPFRLYSSWAESVRDWANLMQVSRYKNALAAAVQGNLDEFAKQVSLAGYATDPSYAGNLVRVGNLIQPFL